MYLLAAIPFVLAAFWLLVLLFRLGKACAARRSRESQVVFFAGLCESYAAMAASVPRLSSRWVDYKLQAESMALQAFEVLSSRRPVAARVPLRYEKGGTAERSFCREEWRGVRS